MFHFFHNRIHEPLALAALFAGSVALHVAWIDNLLLTRSVLIRDWMTLNPDIGPISGLYLDTLGAFLTTFLIACAIWRGRDVAHWRERVFWFFAGSVIVFMFMTLPFVYGFVIS